VWFKRWQKLDIINILRFIVKKKSVYKKKLARKVRAAFREASNLKPMTLSEACARIRVIGNIK